MLRLRGQPVIGMDVVPSERTDVVGSVVDRALVGRVFSENDITGVIHAGALHKPDIARHSPQAFIDTNVTGTLNLLDAAAAVQAPFVFTSTTSLMISQALRDELYDRTVWLDEDYGPLAPRNIYGVTKLAAEGLCRQCHLTRGLNVVVLRTARFFPEEDDTTRTLSGPNLKTNELLNRRASVQDMARAHLAALDKAADVGFGLYIVSAPTPFSKTDRVMLHRDAQKVIAGYLPDARRVYAQKGWSLPKTIGRVYDGSRITRELGFTYETTFADALNAAMRGLASPLVHDADYVSPQVAHATG